MGGMKHAREDHRLRPKIVSRRHMCRLLNHMGRGGVQERAADRIKADVSFDGEVGAQTGGGEIRRPPFPRLTSARKQW